MLNIKKRLRFSVARFCFDGCTEPSSYFESPRNSITVDKHYEETTLRENVQSERCAKMWKRMKSIIHHSRESGRVQWRPIYMYIYTYMYTGTSTRNEQRHTDINAQMLSIIPKHESLLYEKGNH